MLRCPRCQTWITHCPECGYEVDYRLPDTFPGQKRRCRFCGKLFTPKTSNQVFCNTGHKHRFIELRSRKRHAAAGKCHKCRTPLTNDEKDAGYTFCVNCRAKRTVRAERKRRLRELLRTRVSSLLTNGPPPRIRRARAALRHIDRIEAALRLARRRQFLQQVYYVAPPEYRGRKVPLEMPM